MKKLQITLAYLGVIAVWSTTPLGIKYSVSAGNEMVGLVARTFIGLIISMLCLAFISEKIRFRKRDLQIYSVSALGVVGGLGLTYFAASYVSSGMIAIIFGLTPVIASIIAVPILGEKTSGYQYLGILIAVTGLVWVFHNELALGNELGDKRWIGLALLLGAVSCSALSGILFKRLNSGVNPMAINAGSLMISLPFMILIAGGQDYPVLWTNSTVTKAVLYLGIVGSFIGFVLHMYVIQKISAVKAMLVPLVTPVCALLLGYFIAGEQVHLNTLVGAFVILTGLVLFFLNDMQERKVNLSTKAN